MDELNESLEMHLWCQCRPCGACGCFTTIAVMTANADAVIAIMGL